MSFPTANAFSERVFEYKDDLSLLRGRVRRRRDPICRRRRPLFPDHQCRIEVMGVYGDTRGQAYRDWPGPGH